MIDLSTAELHNAFVQADGQVVVRPALVPHLDLSSTNNEIVYGFSRVSPQTNELAHYVLTRDKTIGSATLTVYSEEFQTITSVACGTLGSGTVWSHAVQNGQVLINSPQTNFPIYGIIGGGVKIAQSQTSVNEVNTPTLPVIPSGLVSVFGDRNAIAFQEDVFFNDPGVEIRTYTEANDVALSGGIFAMFEGPSGALVFITANGTYALGADALGQGQEVYGQIQQISPYHTNRFNNAVYVDGEIYCLGQDSLIAMVSGQEIQLSQYRHRRNLTKYVGPGPSGTYQSSRLFALQSGVVISTPQGLLCVVRNNRPSWVYNSSQMFVVGTGYTREGKDLYFTKDRVLEMLGSDEFTGEIISGGGCFMVPNSPADAPVVRAATTSSNNVGFSQHCFIGGNATSVLTRAPARAHNVIGTDVWSSTNTYVGNEIRSARHLQSFRTNDFAAEVMIERPGSVVGGFDFVAKGGGRRRPRN